ncbi:MAG: hypothetical protein KF858_02940 [Candidatus Sumerlaeia bacterium]|nr:hypothetical protein [Candidatus Sumerlaeia bacterium]
MSPCTRVAVIMAGGSGERFWPLSRAQRPKQLLRLAGGEETLLQQAVSRVAPLVSPERVFVATSRILAEAIRAGDARVPAANVLAEPAKRNTTGCLAWAAANLIARHGDPAAVSMAVLTADHLIGPPDAFRACIANALAAAEAHDALVTIGIAPAHPETGYGYIEAEDEAVAVAGLPAGAVRAVRSFREKPDRATAEGYVASGRHYWNSGMFFWRVATFLAELDHAAPAVAAVVRGMAEALRAGDEAAAERLFGTLEDRSIDYVLMEKARRVLLVPATFGWDDVGSWDALARVHAPDAAGNVRDGAAVLADARDCIVVNATGGRTAVGLVGVEGLVVVVTDDAVLVVPKDRVQDVKRIVTALREQGAPQV